MPLTTIDGQLCIPSSEFGHLTTFLGLRETALTDGRRLVSLREAEEEFGAKGRNYHGSDGSSSWSSSYSAFSYLPDEWLIREIYKAIQPATDRTPPKVGEENLYGLIWPGPDGGAGSYWTDEDGQRHLQGFADFSLIGPASLGGKVVLELCRRLAQFCYMDDAAARYHRNPPFSSFPAETPEENIEKECFFHAEQHHEPVHADG